MTTWTWDWHLKCIWGRSVLWDLILSLGSVSTELNFRTSSRCPRIVWCMETQAHTLIWCWEVLSGRNKGKRRMWGFLYQVQMKNVKITITFFFFFWEIKQSSLDLILHPYWVLICEEGCFTWWIMVTCLTSCL